MKKTLITLVLLYTTAPLYSAEPNSHSELPFNISDVSSTGWSEDESDGSIRSISPTLSGARDNNDSLSTDEETSFDDQMEQACFQYHSDLSDQAVSKLEEAYESYDLRMTQSKKESSRHTLTQMSTAQPRQHEKRTASHKRTLNPFEVTTPELLGKQPLGTKTVLQTVPHVYGKESGQERKLHTDICNQQAAFNRGQQKRAALKQVPFTVQQVFAVVAMSRIK